jgi:Fasciclin domain
VATRLGIDAWPCYPEGVGTVIARTPQLSLWHRCLNATSTRSLLEADGPWTLLVPNDALLSAQRMRIEALLSSPHVDVLSDFVESLVIPRSVLAVQIEAQVRSEPVRLSVTNLLDQPIVLEIGSESLRWSGALTLGQVICANGELYVIDQLPQGMDWPLG